MQDGSLIKNEWMLMKAILQNENSAAGGRIFDTAKTIARPDWVSYGLVYPTLERLGRRGLVSWVHSPAEQERTGRSRRYFSVTEKGEKAIERFELAASRVVAKGPIRLDLFRQLKPSVMG
jgi:DNA-binding PadR family transcriptional regulator